MAKNWYHTAGLLWPILTRAASERRQLIYSDVAPLVDTTALNLSHPLGLIQNYCLDTRRPPLTSLMVSKNKGKPGHGFIAWDVDDLETAQQQTYDYPWHIVDNPFGLLSVTDSVDALAARLVDQPEHAEEVYRLVPDRGVAQVVFRAALLSAYDCQCAICGTSYEEVLEAAHIVPWSRSSHRERLSVQNGILLCANHHRLFDEECLVVSDSYAIESHDPKEEDGSFTKADSALTTAFHSKSLTLPKDERLWPSPCALRAKYERG